MPPRSLPKTPPSQLDREIAHFLAGRTVSAGKPGEDLEDTGHWQQQRKSYQRATPAQVIRKLGADHVAYILRQPAPAHTARGRARGMWDANDLETMSAYDRLAILIDEGRIK